jgi:hypothetical protein
VINGSGGSIDVTITSQQTCQLNNTVPANTVVTIANGKTFDIKLVPLEMLALDDGDWRVNFIADVVTTVTLAVLKV